MSYREIEPIIESDDPERMADLIRANPSYLNDECLQDTAGCGSLRVVQCLIELGADVNSRNCVIKSTALEEATNAGHIPVMEYLLARGAKFDLTVPHHNPYYGAMRENHVAVVKYLLSLGVNPHVAYRTLSGRLRNALVHAQEKERREIADLLIVAGCKVPIEGVDFAVNEAEVQAILKKERGVDWEVHRTPNDSSLEEEIVRYVSQRFGPADELALREILPVLADVHVAIHVIPPSNQHPFMTLFTTGMSSRAMRVPAGQEAWEYGELMMHLPPTWLHPREAKLWDTALFWPIQVLRQAAYLPHVNDTWYGVCHTVALSDPPEPLGPNTLLTSMLLVADKLKPLEISSGKTIRFFTIYTLYTEELQIALNRGIDELLNRLQSHQVTPLVEIERNNVGVD